MMFRSTISLLILVFGISACGSDPCDDVDCSGAGSCADVDGEAICTCDYDYDSVGDDCEAKEPGLATQVSANIHSGYADVDLKTMTTDMGLDEYSFSIAMGDSGPQISLAEGVMAFSLGSDFDFHEESEAPVDGYTADTDETLVIGQSFQVGGDGTAGYTMSEDIWIILLADGTYAKVEFLSAKSGVFEILAWLQTDGSRYIATTTSID